MRLSFTNVPLVSQLAIVLLAFFATVDSPPTRTPDVIYMKSGGAAFTLDVLTPAKPNKAAVVLIVSGGWYSDHSMIKTMGAEMEKTFASNGFTVFTVIHGAQPRYKVTEIVEQVRSAVRFVHAHAADYGIDTNRVGVVGISSGGHLALMIAGSPSSPVNAVAAIAPPTDLANWGKPGFILTDDPQMAVFDPALGIDPKAARSEIETLVKQLSPITLVNAKSPPTLLVHGDADQIVPIQQSQSLDQALTKAGVQHKLEVVAGAGHDDKTFKPGVSKALQWFKDTLLQ